MSEKHPDSHFGFAATGSVTEETVEINREFLRLLTHPCVRGSRQLLGLQGGVLAALAQLDQRELQQVASVPLLLAEFQPFPGFGEVRDTPVSRPCDPELGEEWLLELNDFANRLLTCIWQTSRRDPMLTSLLMGVSRTSVQQLAEFGFSSISRCALQASGSLQVRLNRHPRFWSDLVGLVRTGNDCQQMASRLSLIQLSVKDACVSVPQDPSRVYS
ncbi:MAG: hypothetical protein GY758_30050 [Fuerstiella sp.]|nr:hypothetical protein [Fuerstiella sp.]